MAQKVQNDGSYNRFSDSVKTGRISNFYIFHGEERYLLDWGIGELRKRLCPDGLGGFNYQRFDSKNVTGNELEAAVNTFPAFAERTLIEIYDFDIFKSEQKQIFCDILSDLPEYVCVVIIFDIVAYKPDGRVKLDAAIIKSAEVVNFSTQEQDKLIKWIGKNFADYGKRISRPDAEYLVYVTGGMMISLTGEIGKVASYAIDEAVTRSDIDAVVIPVLDAVVYRLTDAVATRDHKEAMRIMDELLQMQEAPHKLLFSISIKMRQILTARVLCIEGGINHKDFMGLCEIKYDFQAKSVIDAARRMSLAECRNSVLCCAETAYEFNSAPDPELRLIELLTKLALKR